MFCLFVFPNSHKNQLTCWMRSPKTVQLIWQSMRRRGYSIFFHSSWNRGVVVVVVVVVGWQKIQPRSSFWKKQEFEKSTNFLKNPILSYKNYLAPQTIAIPGKCVSTFRPLLHFNTAFFRFFFFEEGWKRLKRIGTESFFWSFPPWSRQRLHSPISPLSLSLSPLSLFLSWRVRAHMGDCDAAAARRWPRFHQGELFLFPSL